MGTIGIKGLTELCCFVVPIFQWLENIYPPYLDAWQTSINRREGFSQRQRKRMILSTETLLGLQITGMLCYHNKNECRIMSFCSEIICGVSSVPVYHPRGQYFSAEKYVKILRKKIWDVRDKKEHLMRTLMWPSSLRTHMR